MAGGDYDCLMFGIDGQEIERYESETISDMELSIYKCSLFLREKGNNAVVLSLSGNNDNVSYKDIKLISKECNNGSFYFVSHFNSDKDDWELFAGIGVYGYDCETEKVVNYMNKNHPGFKSNKDSMVYDLHSTFSSKTKVTEYVLNGYLNWEESDHPEQQWFLTEEEMERNNLKSEYVGIAPVLEEFKEWVQQMVKENYVHCQEKWVELIKKYTP